MPDQIRQESMDKLFFVYGRPGDGAGEGGLHFKRRIYRLNEIKEEKREELNRIFGVPMLVVSSLSGDSEETAAMKQKMGLPEDGDMFAVLEQTPREQLHEIFVQQSEKFEQMPESIVTQTAVSYVQGEYAAMGLDVMRFRAIMSRHPVCGCWVWRCW